MFRLVGSVRRVHMAQAELVAAAVAQERLRVEAEVSGAVSAELTEIARRPPGRCLDPASEIGELTDLSRSALARARATWSATATRRCTLRSSSPPLLRAGAWPSRSATTQSPRPRASGPVRQAELRPDRAAGRARPGTSR
ncbi:hypothetical protein HBB16_14245 [Pseudonocardia sp. MCCB 268]|nr:hypothetical protein [Pseudonocardia cytotoxica]